MKAAIFGLIFCVAMWAQQPAPTASADTQKSADVKQECDHQHDASHLHAAGEDCEHHRADPAKLGFDPAKTQYKIKLLATGGTFQIAVKDASDKELLAKVRNHLMHVAKRFAEGDFSAHTYIHGEQAPGAAIVSKRAKSVKYQYHETADGGQIVVTTKDAESLKGVHEFLKAEIALHETGDPVTVGGK